MPVSAAPTAATLSITFKTEGPQVLFQVDGQKPFRPASVSPELRAYRALSAHICAEVTKARLEEQAAAGVPTPTAASASVQKPGWFARIRGKEAPAPSGPSLLTPLQAAAAQRKRANLPPDARLTSATAEVSGFVFGLSDGSLQRADSKSEAAFRFALMAEEMAEAGRIPAGTLRLVNDLVGRVTVPLASEQAEVPEVRVAPAAAPPRAALPPQPEPELEDIQVSVGNAPSHLDVSFEELEPAPAPGRAATVPEPAEATTRLESVAPEVTAVLAPPATSTPEESPAAAQAVIPPAPAAPETPAALEPPSGAQEAAGDATTAVGEASGGSAEGDSNKQVASQSPDVAAPPGGGAEAGDAKLDAERPRAEPKVAPAVVVQERSEHWSDGFVRLGIGRRPLPGKPAMMTACGEKVGQEDPPALAVVAVKPEDVAVILWLIESGRDPRFKLEVTPTEDGKGVRANIEAATVLNSSAVNTPVDWKKCVAEFQTVDKRVQDPTSANAQKSAEVESQIATGPIAGTRVEKPALEKDLDVDIKSALPDKPQLRPLSVPKAAPRPMPQHHR